VRSEHPAWGGRKIRARLRQQAADGKRPLVPEEVPAASTCQTIIKRHGLGRETDRRHTSFERFEKEAPNRLWQMDFKGHFPLTDGERCHALTIVDDHSRFALALQACEDEKRHTVKERLRAVFRRYGLPRRILCDNGLPWGVPGSKQARRSLYTRLNAWLFRLGVDVVHGRPYHPETQGKNERFHRSLNEELLQQGSYQSLSECQSGFDQWRQVYNLKRPHEALDLQVPSSRYQPSGRRFPETLPDIEYPSAKHVRTVGPSGQI
jgi:transposase InsO family protein